MRHVLAYLVLAIVWAMSAHAQGQEEPGIEEKVVEEAAPARADTAAVAKDSVSEDRPIDAAGSSEEDTTHVSEEERERRAARRAEIRAVKEEARRLRRDAERLSEIAEELESEVDDLEEKGEELADRARTSGRVLSGKGEGVGGEDARDSVGETEPATLEERHRALLAQLRMSSDSLLQKARDINLKVSQMGEEAGKRIERAAELEEKAEELDTRPYTERFPLSFGYQNHYMAVPPYDDNDAHFVHMSGFYVSYSFRPFLTAGVSDMMLYFNNTVKGTRFAGSLAPFVSGTFLVLRRMEIEVGAGLTLQGQTGSSGDSDAAMALFLSVGDEIWVADHFSLGPVFRINYAVIGNLYASAFPLSSSDVIPKGAAWLDAGLSFSLHF